MFRAGAARHLACLTISEASSATREQNAAENRRDQRVTGAHQKSHGRVSGADVPPPELLHRGLHYTGARLAAYYIRTPNRTQP